MIRDTWQHIRELCGLNSGANVTREDVRLELLEFGLLGRTFSIHDDLKPAVEQRVGKKIIIELYPDQHQGVVFDDRLQEGVLADVSYSDDKSTIIILVRESLQSRPWPAYELCLLHELSHLIAKHHLKRRNLNLQEFTIKDSWVRPRKEQDELEVEARNRAKLLLLARISPEAFEHAGRDRVT